MDFWCFWFLGFSLVFQRFSMGFQGPHTLGPELKNTFVESRPRTGDPRTSLVDDPGT